VVFYGDDFTGSTDVLESLARAGLRTVLFLQAPTPAQLRRFSGLGALGIAGTARTMTPAEMTRALPPVFRALRALRAPVVHYKICSTFDSSPRIGSIGKAIDLAQVIFRSPFVPLLVGAPILGRYCVFGNLFARSGLDSEPHRLDRHPTMRRHPTTPMDEADLRLHLAKQTARKIGLLDLLQLESRHAARRLRQLQAQGVEIVLFDVFNDRHLLAIGELIDGALNPRRSWFVVGSSGVEYALLAWWRKCGIVNASPPRFVLEPAPAVVVVSGSCSPVTHRQIQCALAAGYADVALDTEALVDPRTRAAALGRALAAAAPHFAARRSVIFHTARGPQDPRLVRTARILKSRRMCSAATLGSALGELLAAAFQRTGWKRGVVTGGDSSSFAARALRVEALEFAAPIAPGAPLCRVHAPGQVAHEHEIVFKGGQNGPDDFLLTVRHGQPAPGATRRVGRPAWNRRVTRGVGDGMRV
jgi:uncharacterized protein YgbK (DUF1537 family)